eukprot:jgi/Ulvmu1/2605/UM014_0056.1
MSRPTITASALHVGSQQRQPASSASAFSLPAMQRVAGFVTALLPASDMVKPALSDEHHIRTAPALLTRRQLARRSTWTILCAFTSRAPMQCYENLSTLYLGPLSRKTVLTRDRPSC